MKKYHTLSKRKQNKKQSGGKSTKRKNAKKTHKNTFRQKQNRFFNGGAYPGPPYGEMDVRLDPQRQLVDSRQLPNLKGGKKRTLKQRGGSFYGVDILKSISGMNPYPLANLTGLNSIPSSERLLAGNPIVNGENVTYKGRYLV